MEREVITLAAGWEVIQTVVTRVINTLEGIPESPMDGEFSSRIHTTVYNMCTQKPPHDYSMEIYERHRGVYNDYLQSKVLLAIQEKHDGASMLQELVQRWENHKVMVTKLSRFFNYLNRYFIIRRALPALKDVAFDCFGKIVFLEMEVRVKDAVISLINQEREGQEIDRSLLKSVLEIFVDTINMESYANDFETAFLNDTKNYYTAKASNWTPEECAAKAGECLQREKDRVAHYMHYSTEEKLLKIVQDVLSPAQTVA